MPVANADAGNALVHCDYFESPGCTRDREISLSQILARVSQALHEWVLS